MSKNIILLGFGYMANRVANKLQQMELISGKTIFSLSRSQSVNLPWLQHIRFDLDKTDNNPFISNKVINQSSILYLIPPPNTGQSDPRMRNFLHLIKQTHVIPEKITLISTTGVYGNCDGEWIDESRAVNPNIDRAYRRVDAENQLQKYCLDNKINCNILRVSGIYAADKLPLARIKKQLPIVNKDDSAYSNRIHAEDLTTICCQSIIPELSGYQNDGIYNCSDNRPSTMYDYFTRLAATYHLPPPPVINIEQAQNQLSAGMLSYMQESRRIRNKKLLADFNIELKYPSLDSFLATIKP
jgi:nucleoside-diphosphate-sugar epimerase